MSILAERVLEFLMQTDEFVSWREFLSSGYTAALCLVGLGVWLHAADSLIVATMMPAMLAEIGGAGLVAWNVSLYEIGSILAGAMAALCAARFGLQKPMGFSAILFGLGCALAAIAWSMPVVLVGRVLQGLGGGGLVAFSFVAVTVMFPRRLMARTFAVISTLWGVSAFLGPLIGGFFVEYATWRMGFWAFGGQAFLLAMWIFMRQGMPKAQVAPESVPVRRLAVLTLGVLSIAYAGVDVGWVKSTLFVGIGLMFLAGFLWLETREGAVRTLPRRPFSTGHRAGAALLMILCLSIGTIAITAYGPLLMVIIHGVSVLTAGYVVACSSIGWSVMAIVVSGSPERYDGHFIAMGVGVVVLSILGFVYSVATGPIWLVMIFALLEGGGFGMCWTFIIRRASAGLSDAEAGRLAGAFPTVQRLGYALGAAYIGIVANAVGFEAAMQGNGMERVAIILFTSGLPFAALGAYAASGLIRR